MFGKMLSNINLNSNSPLPQRKKCNPKDITIVLFTDTYHLFNKNLYKNEFQKKLRVLSIALFAFMQ